MNGILITGGKCVGAIVSPDRPIAYFEQLGRLGLNMQSVTLGQGPVEGRIWVDTGSDVVEAQVVDSLAGAAA